MSSLKNKAKGGYRVFQAVLFDPIEVARKLKGLPFYIRDAIRYVKNSRNKTFRVGFTDLYPILAERFMEAGSARGHYFFQDIWAARKLKEMSIQAHVDVGSRLDGFVAHVLLFSKVTYVDIRPLGISVDGLEFKQGSILRMPFPDGSVPSLSSLHVLEHIGLGRYGDPVDPSGHITAAKELKRILSPNGSLLIGVPVGKERLCFNAHRVFDPATVAGLFEGLKLKEFSLINDSGVGIIHNASFEQARSCDYGCGLFTFIRES